MLVFIQFSCILRTVSSVGLTGSLRVRGLDLNIIAIWGFLVCWRQQTIPITTQTLVVKYRFSDVNNGYKTRYFSRF